MADATRQVEAGVECVFNPDDGECLTHGCPTDWMSPGHRCDVTGLMITKNRCMVCGAIYDATVYPQHRCAAVAAAQIEPPPWSIIVAACSASTRSPCQSKRGAVLFRAHVSGGLIATGYNHKPREFACDGSDACKSTCRVEAIHAEQHTLLTAGREESLGADLLHVKTVNGDLIPSGPPSCVQCSKLALAAGVAHVWLFHEDGWHRYLADEFHRLSLSNQRVII